ncbi:MAG TPA: NTP transferase domain-containing protein [Polyangia bacterium]
MKVALLAAGLGSRLGPLTTDLPKALVKVGEQPLLIHALRFAARLAPSEIVVVGGFCFDQVAAVLEDHRAAVGANLGCPMTLVENRDFRQGNILSLQTARPHLTDDFVLLNVDHIFRPAIAAVVAAPTADVTAFIDTDRTLGADDMKVKRDPEGRIEAISKTLSRFDCGYVGMTRVPRPALSRYFSVVDAAIAAEGTTIHVERVLARLAEAGQPPLCRDISGHGWLEVDTPSERESAEAALQKGAW